MKEAKAKGYQTELTPDDRLRMARLFEEADARMREMLRIVARTLEKPTGDLGTARFRISTDPATAQAEGKSVYHTSDDLELFYWDGECIGTYDHQNGTCEDTCSSEP
ncbi:MAG: hypothetical protein QNJ97_28735 [Myxococcota bacterium]|nr:hypothetical protein [Myxococcota bacterium]